MKWQDISKAALLTGSALIPLEASATVYYSLEQVQNLLFPGAKFQKVNASLTTDQIQSLKKQTGVFTTFKMDQIYKVNNGEGWLFIDQVIGKHEMITYAVALNQNGVVKQVEVMEYNESYGGQIRNKSWRDQFVGKTAASPLQLNQDIKNISGATLSSKHLTEGIKRITLAYQQFFANKV